MPSTLFAPLTLPSGAVAPNRLAKAAGEENMAVAGKLSGDQLIRLYRGGVGAVRDCSSLATLWQINHGLA